jgi:amino acid transporter
MSWRARSRSRSDSASTIETCSRYRCAALLSYSFLQVGLYGAFGPNAASEAAAHLHVHEPWWVWALGAWAVITVLGLLRVDITGRVLGVLLCAEIIVILAETVSGLAHPAGGHLSFATLSPTALTSAGFGTFGVLAVVAVLGFVGFEQAPVLAEEARNARRTIPVATYLALGMIAVVYAGVSWAMAARNGDSHVVAAAGQQGPGLLPGLGGSGALSQAAQWLFLTSLFAAALAFHNCVWRYIFALGRESVLPAALAAPAATTSRRRHRWRRARPGWPSSWPTRSPAGSR